jgi:hypothetical protein
MRRRQDRLRRAELLWYLAGFLAVQAALAVGVEWLWPRVRDPEFDCKERRLYRRLAGLPERPLVVGLGSSRMRMALEAQRLTLSPFGPPELVFNLGVPASGPMMELTCLRRLLAGGARPDIVLIEVMPNYFNEHDGYPLEERHLDGARLTAAEVARLAPYYHGPERLLLPWCAARLLPSFRHQAEVREALGLDRPADHPPPGPYDGMDHYGFQPHYTTLTEERRERFTLQALAQYRNTYDDFHLDPRPCQALRDLLELCRRQGIDAALIVMPESSRFRALCPEPMRAQVDAFVEGLRREFNLPLIDAGNWVPDELFWDGHHLLPTGAGLFMRRFECETLWPMVRRRGRPAGINRVGVVSGMP